MGRVDVLVSNAGLGGQTPVVDMTDDEWARVLYVTQTPVFQATRAALRYFREALTRCSAIEAVDCGVRINAVSPSIARHKFVDKETSAKRLSADEASGRAAEPWK